MERCVKSLCMVAVFHFSELNSVEHERQWGLRTLVLNVTFLLFF